jgi:argininosuccinate lyase
MTDIPFEMTKLQKLEKAVLLLEEQVATNKEMNENYQKELEEAKKELKDYNKPELTPAQLDDVHNAIENAVNEHLGTVYRSTKHFVFGNWREDLQPGMVEQFDEVYNKAKQW